MQDARDTFYITLRNRLAAVNPYRTIVVRGQVRPGLLVAENELATALQAGALLPDAFTLRWASLKMNTSGPMPLVTMECEFSYSTDGRSGNGGMDRGRLLAAMDAELTAALTQLPQSTVKLNYSGVAGTGATATAMATNIFWSQPSFTAAKANGERLERLATVEVFSYQEVGEL